MALRGGAVSYERGTPVHHAPSPCPLTPGPRAGVEWRGKRGRLPRLQSTHLHTYTLTPKPLHPAPCKLPSNPRKHVSTDLMRVVRGAESPPVPPCIHLHLRPDDSTPCTLALSRRMVDVRLPGAGVEVGREWERLRLLLASQPSTRLHHRSTLHPAPCTLVQATARGW